VPQGRGSRRQKGRKPKSRPAGPGKSLAGAELENAIRRAQAPDPHDPAGILSARQKTPPRVVGHVDPEVERAILED
jgi:hypothetical protein